MLCLLNKAVTSFDKKVIDVEKELIWRMENGLY